MGVRGARRGGGGGMGGTVCTSHGKMLGAGLVMPLFALRYANRERSLPSSVWKYKGRSAVAMLPEKTSNTSLMICKPSVLLASTSLQHDRSNTTQ
jgi:hypothetical protein